LLYLLVACCAALPPVAAAQGYPSRQVTLVVPFPPGGGNDFMARIFSEKLGVALGTQVVVDNRPGAGGTIGTEYVGRAARRRNRELTAGSGTNTDLVSRGLSDGPYRHCSV
jgi:tripartite-type tricarboxylate transporter receptor subunit TctC